MYHLATIFPPIRRIGKLPLSRDQFMLLMVAVNEIFLGVEHYFAHLISGTFRPYELVPIIFGPVAGALLLVVGLIALRWRITASVIATVILLIGIFIGLWGWYLHFIRAILPTAAIGEQISIPLLVWAPPVLGPLTASLVGLLGISAAWKENPIDTGRLELFGGRRVQLPYSKTQAFFFMVGLGTLATLISSVLDHARTEFENPWLWAPIAVGVFGTVVAVMLGAIDRPKRGDLIIYLIAMLLLIAVGMAGAWLHIQEDLATQGAIVPERFIRGAPFMAPLLFSDMGALGLIVLLDPSERGS